MPPSKKYYFTNWINGMKIQKDHFIDSENALIEYVNESNTFNLNKFNYGLLKPAGAHKTSIEVRVLRSQTNSFKISLSLCRAITPGGIIIELMPETHTEILCETNLDTDNRKNGAYYAVVSVNPYNRVPFGNLSADESPIRHPYATPDYKMALMAEENISLPEFREFHFPVARFIAKSANELMPDESYIPPCSAIQGHIQLIAIYSNLVEKLNSIRELSDIIIQKIIAKSQNFPLAQNINKLCLKTSEYISSVFFDIVNIFPFQPPIFIIRTVIHLASFVNSALRLIPEKEKEEMLQYFKEWNNITPGEFKAMLDQAIDLNYNHNDLAGTFLPVNNFIAKWFEILEKLSENEIGKKKNTADIMIGQKYEEKKKGFSLLD